MGSCVIYGGRGLLTSLVFEKDSSAALGFGFRCGFLGLLHLEVVQERLEREYNLSLIITAPSVRFQIETTDGNEMEIDNPALYPDPSTIERTREPTNRGPVSGCDPPAGARTKTSATGLTPINDVYRFG